MSNRSSIYYSFNIKSLIRNKKRELKLPVVPIHQLISKGRRTQENVQKNPV